MSITLKRWEPETDFSRQALLQAVEETRTHDQKQKDYENQRKQWRTLNPEIEIRSLNHA